MTNIIHIMLDLETWGNEPGRDIRSIGACVFDPSNGAVNPVDGEHHPSHFYIATDNPECVTYTPTGTDGTHRRYPLTRDPQTVQWWNDQGAEAQVAFTDPVDLREACSRFAGWLDHVTAAFRPIEYPSKIPTLINEDGSEETLDVRTYGRVHDEPVPLHKWDGLRLWSHGPAYDPPILAAVFKAVGLPVPWHYRAPRDTRTIFEAAGIDPVKWYELIGDRGTHHHALHDAIAQARAVCLAHERLRRPWNRIEALERAIDKVLSAVDVGEATEEIGAMHKLLDHDW